MFRAHYTFYLHIAKSKNIVSETYSWIVSFKIKFAVVP